MAQFFGLTRDGQVTSEREYVAEEAGHTAMFGVVDGDWCVDVRGPGGSEHTVYAADVPVAIRAHMLGLDCAEDALEQVGDDEEFFAPILRAWWCDTQSGDEDALDSLAREIGIDGDDEACEALAEVFRRAYSDRLCRAAREWSEREQYGLGHDRPQEIERHAEQAAWRDRSGDESPSQEPDDGHRWYADFADLHGYKLTNEQRADWRSHYRQTVRSMGGNKREAE